MGEGAKEQPTAMRPHMSEVSAACTSLGGLAGGSPNLPEPSPRKLIGFADIPGSPFSALFLCNRNDLIFTGNSIVVAAVSVHLCQTSSVMGPCYVIGSLVVVAVPSTS